MQIKTKINKVRILVNHSKKKWYQYTKTCDMTGLLYKDDIVIGLHSKR